VETHDRGHLPEGTRAKSRGGVVDPAWDELPVGVARRRWWRWSRLPGLLLAFVAMVTLVALLNGTRFLVQPVLEGAQLVPGSELIQHTGIVGQSLFLVRPAEVQRRLLRAYPCLESVTVETQLPNQVRIRVQEKPDVMVWESAGQRWWVDGEGTVLGAANQTLGLVTVEDAIGIASADKYVPGVPWRMAQEMALTLRAAPRFYFQEQGLTLYVQIGSHDVPVYLGCEGSGRVKAAVLEALVERLESEGTTPAYVDLSSDESPVFQLNQG